MMLVRSARDLGARLPLLAMLALAGCTAEARDGDNGATAAKPATSAAVTAPSIQAAPSAEASPSEPAAREPADDTGNAALELAGDLRPEAAADLAFKVGGQLMSVKVKRGERVKKGQLLATLSDIEARGQLSQTEATIVSAQAQLALAQDNEARAVSLAAASAAPTSQAKTLHLQAEVAKAGVAQAEAARDLAAAVLANYQIKAPFDGEIVRVPDGLGGIVSPATVLFRIEALDRLTLRTTVGEAELSRIHVGDDVQIELGNGRKVIGKVRVVLRSLEAQSRRAPIEIDVPNADRALVAGSYVRASLKK